MVSEKTRIMMVETSGRIGSVAVAQGPEILREEQFSGRFRHGSELLPTMDRLCRGVGWRPRDIEHFYVSAGPGSFTGIRIAITAAKTLAFCQPTKIVAVPSCEVAVLNAARAAQEMQWDIRQVAVVLEAGRKKIFAALFERTTLRPGQTEQNVMPSADGVGGSVPGFRVLLETTILSPADLLERTDRPVYLMGEGLKYHPSELRGEGIVWLDEHYWTATAAHVHQCGWLRAQQGLFADPDVLTPLYFRRPEALEKWDEIKKC